MMGVREAVGKLCAVRRTRLVTASALSILSFFAATPKADAQAPAGSQNEIIVDVNGATQPFPHFWEQMFGSGRAVLSLREGYRDDLRDVKKVTNFQYIRFHGIFLDEVGLYDEDKDGKPVYNFSYVDQIYDGLLQNHVRPFVELSFMPHRLTSDPKAVQAFWYQPNVAPPKDWGKWEQLVEVFTRHLVERYGLDEVAQWYFEVWNEPNLDFWGGQPRDTTYFELYDRSARAVKRVSPRLRVGGPATAQAAWADRFLAHCKEKNVPVDFLSTHVYGNDKAEDVFGTHEVIPRDQMVCRSVKKVHDQILASAFPAIPLIWSEFNAAYDNQSSVTDAAYMGPWMADTIRQCQGLTQMMSYWDFSDVFEEQGVIKQPFYGGFGLLAERGIPKPAFNAFALLHRLGEVQIPVPSDHLLVTRRPDGTLIIAAWGHINAPEEPPPATEELHLDLRGLGRGKHTAKTITIDEQHGTPLPAYEKMGSPKTLSLEQIAQLKTEAQLPPAQSVQLQGEHLSLNIPPRALVVAEIKP
jgi:xylan 1,4-beta-xylosidase